MKKPRVWITRTPRRCVPLLPQRPADPSGQYRRSLPHTSGRSAISTWRSRTKRLLLGVAAVLPFAVATADGCSDEPPFQSVCAWLENPENCFREFHRDMLLVKGLENPDGDCRTYPPLPTSAWPTEASPASSGKSNGSFQKRAMLDTCILDTGGQVTVSPPIDLTMFPPSPYADPISYTFSFVNLDGTECGSATYTSPHGFSITIDPPYDAGTTAIADAGGDASLAASAFTNGDGGPPFISYGTYTQTNPPGRDSVDVTCPTGDSFHFTLDELDIANPDGGDCPHFAGIMPSASLQIYPGGVDVPGAVSFAIAYPPAPPPTGSDAYQVGGPPLEAVKVVYFNCAIPPAQETCMDGVKDGFETDVDCGGPQMPSMLFCRNCPPRCATMQQCLCDGDCGANLVCAVNTMTGMRQCMPADAGVGEDFPTCGYTDAPPSCPDAGSDAPTDAATDG
jgi:hypothetical protein